MRSTWLFTGILLAGLGVAIGAIGAHSLKALLSQGERAATFEIGVKYHLFHALALIALAIWAQRPGNNAPIKRIAICFLLGIICFSGSLYLLAILVSRPPAPLVYVTPVGGMLFLIGWGLWGWQVMQSETN